MKCVTKKLIQYNENEAMNKQCTCIICESRDIEVIERAMARVDAMQRPSVDSPPMWVGAVIIAAFAVWVVAMLAKTGV